MTSAFLSKLSGRNIIVTALLFLCVATSALPVVTLAQAQPAAQTGDTSAPSQNNPTTTQVDVPVNVSTFTPVTINGQPYRVDPVTNKVYNPDGSPAVDGNKQPIQNPSKVVPESNCSFYNFSFAACIWMPLMAWLGSWFLTIGGALLNLAGYLFDTVIYYTIITFKATLDNLHITTPIENAWTVFRDFSNILIIGMFIFIAICLILGIKEFGSKKTIANVLLIAILINFSLLFARLIIDASNFSAYAIYSQMAGQNRGNAATPDASATGEKNFDIAAAFLRPMGITSVWDDTYNVTKAVGQQNKNSGAAAFFFGLVGGLLLLFVAAVLFYGCFLILARAVLMIFLMITASFAFASLLVPQLSKTKFGWGGWWKSLINNAILAPLMMLLLAISLSLINAAGSVTVNNRLATPQVAAAAGTNPGGTLGSIISDPSVLVSSNSAANGWNTIMTYVIGIGLLYLSFKMASSFSSAISGFAQVAAMLTGVGGFGLALGASGTGWALRNSAGKYAARGLARMKTSIYDNQGREATTGELRTMRALNWLSRKSFDAGNVKAVKGAFGSSSSLAQSSDAAKKGYAGVKAEQGKHAMDVAKQVSLNDTERLALVQARRSAAEQTQQPSRDYLGQARQTYEQHRDVAATQAGQQEQQRVVDSQQGQRTQIADERVAAQAVVDETRRQLTQAQNEQAGSDTSYQQLISSTRQRIQNAQQQLDGSRTDEDKQHWQTQLDDLNQTLQSHESEQRQDQTAFAARISQHQQTIQAHEEEVTRLNASEQQLNLDARTAGDAQATRERDWANQNIQNINQTVQGLDASLNQLANATSQALGTQSQTAQRIGHDRVGSGYGTIGTLDTDPVAKAVRSQWRSNQQNEQIRQLITSLGQQPQQQQTQQQQQGQQQGQTGNP